MSTLVGERIRAVRGLSSRAAFSKRIGISAWSLRNYEKGAVVPNAEVLAMICREFGADPSWLLGVNDCAPEVSREAGLADKDLAHEKGSGQAEAFEEATPPIGGGAPDTELVREREERRALSEELCKIVAVLRDLSAENKRLWLENREWRERAHALDLENTRLLARRTRGETEKRRAGHVERMSLVPGGRIQEKD